MAGEGRQQPPRNIPALMAHLHGEKFTGAVVVSADPGGEIHLRDGLVVAVTTPGAPSPRTVLMKSLRITDKEWSAALATARGPGGLEAAIVRRGLVGAVELEIVCLAAVYDGAFSLALRRAEDWRADDAVDTPEFALAAGIEPQLLTEETQRRIALLNELAGPLSDLAAARPQPSLRTGAEYLTARHHDILAAANGRRTARDIAFALGCGVYPVMLDLIRLSERGFVRLDAGREQTTAPSVAPRSRSAEPREADDRMAPPSPLPRRPPRRQQQGRAEAPGRRGSAARGQGPVEKPDQDQDQAHEHLPRAADPDRDRTPRKAGNSERFYTSEVPDTSEGPDAPELPDAAGLTDTAGPTDAPDLPDAPGLPEAPRSDS